MDNQKIANRVGRVTIIWNVILSVAKFIAGIVGKSSAMISDSVHSLSDVISTIVAMIGIKIANKTSDDEHQYGHEKYECIASILLAFILFVTGVSIALKGFEKFVSGSGIEPTYIALLAAIISIIVKEIMYRYTIYYGNKINSVALKADAHHHRSDALSSIGAAIGIITSMTGFIYGDIIASFIIAIIICIEAVNIFKESMDKLVDKACDKSIITNIENIINNINGVENIDRLRTRQFGSKIYIDVDIAVNGDLKLTQAHDIAEDVHDTIEHQIENCKHIMVHVNPYTK